MARPREARSAEGHELNPLTAQALHQEDRVPDARSQFAQFRHISVSICRCVRGGEASVFAELTIVTAMMKECLKRRLVGWARERLAARRNPGRLDEFNAALSPATRLGASGDFLPHIVWHELHLRHAWPS